MKAPGEIVCTLVAFFVLTEVLVFADPSAPKMREAISNIPVCIGKHLISYNIYYCTNTLARNFLMIETESFF